MGIPIECCEYHAAAFARVELPFHESAEYHKQQIIKRALARAGGSQTQAAELLSLQRTYLARLIKQMDIK